MKSFDSLLNLQAALDQYTVLSDVVRQMNSYPLRQTLEEIRVATQNPMLDELRKGSATMQALQSCADAVAGIASNLPPASAYESISETFRQATHLSQDWVLASRAAKEFSAIAGLQVSELARIAKSIQVDKDRWAALFSEVTAEDIEQQQAAGNLTPESVAEAVGQIRAEASQGKPTIPDRINKVKRTNWYFAISLLLLIFSFISKPVIDHTVDAFLEATGIAKFWEQSGAYELIDRIFSRDASVSEEEAKATVEAPVGNIAKEKREAVVEKINAIRAYIAAAPQDENTRNLKTYLSELEKELGAKKYGLVFEEHREAIDGVLEAYTPVLTEDTDRFIDHGGEMNYLLEGDNLAALELLRKTHLGRIDLIYIDPPYNRGKTDFIYDDDFISREDTFRHSKWASFMQRRLELAKDLLSEKGLLFISIDDNEVAPAKMICDGVFGEDQFINLFVWQRNSSAKTEKGKFTVNTEYVLLYANTQHYRLNPAYKPLSAASQKLFKFDDGDGRGKYQTVSLQKPKDPGPETTYDYVDNTGKTWPCPPKGWRMKFEKIKALENDNRLVLSGKTLRVKDYWNERENEGKRIDTLWNDLPQNTAGSSELETIMGEANSFDNPKPTDLIKRCLEIGGDAVWILDFFAGSGTTGHAVMKANAEDGGHRRFILCTNNENGICENVTYERLKRVMERDGYAASLKYEQIRYVPISEQVYYEYADELLCHIRELVELENGINFTGNAEIAIVLTDEELTEFMDHPEDFAKCHTLYLGHDILPTGEQIERLQARGVQIHVIPDYYYRDLEG